MHDPLTDAETELAAALMDAVDRVEPGRRRCLTITRDTDGTVSVEGHSRMTAMLRRCYELEEETPKEPVA